MTKLSFARYRTEFKFTHYLFRFPAKFHPPVLRCLIERFSRPGETILDPFCGSGTLLVEALLRGRNAVGLDIDPVATFISRVKSTPIDPGLLERDFQTLKLDLRRLRRRPSEYERLIHEDLAPSAVRRFRRRLAIPEIPNIEHWFRIYVVLDLARLRLAILKTAVRPRNRGFFLACFASIIRSASNADPVPVSGLEVTAHMKKRDERGRRIDPFELFEARVARELRGMKELWEHAVEVRVSVRRGDVTELTRTVEPRSVDVVITSPPYNTAVDYCRRHTLEMYWLGLVKSHHERRELAGKYIGRAQVRRSDAKLRSSFKSGYITRLIGHAGEISKARERVLTHYCASMQRALQHVARVLKPRGRAVIVLGNSQWNGRRVRASLLLREIAKDQFTVTDLLTYATHNRYMSYTRHNGANINREYVLVLKKKLKRKLRKKA